MALPDVRDEVVVARLLAGDDRALADVYDRFSGLVFGLARRVTKDQELATEITQDVFAFLWEFPDRVDLARGSLRAYLGVLTHRRAVDAVRRSVRRNRAEDRAAADVDVRDAWVDSHEADVLEDDFGRWRRDKVQGLLDQLPEEQRAALMLAYFDGRTYREVAVVLGIPEGTAKSRLRLALARLRSLLEKDDEATAWT